MFQEVEVEKEKWKSSGMLRVPMSTAPPVKLPGLSGVKLFTVTMFSSMLEGNMSMATARRLGSALGSSAPLSCTVL